ncbi:MAG: hypothetical protein ACR2OZ_16670 [Verrucomicrobiales bacterium]
MIEPGPEFRVTVFTQTDPFTYTMGWPATVGCVYRIQTSTDFQSWAALSGDLPANQTFMATDIDLDPSEPQRFYRVKLVE